MIKQKVMERAIYNCGISLVKLKNKTSQEDKYLDEKLHALLSLRGELKRDRVHIEVLLATLDTQKPEELHLHNMLQGLINSTNYSSSQRYLPPDRI